MCQFGTGVELDVLRRSWLATLAEGPTPRCIPHSRSYCECPRARTFQELRRQKTASSFRFRDVVTKKRANSTGTPEKREVFRMASAYSNPQSIPCPVFAFSGSDWRHPVS
jgi:hypothetical protein